MLDIVPVIKDRLSETNRFIDEQEFLLDEIAETMPYSLSEGELHMVNKQAQTVSATVDSERELRYDR